MGRIVTFNFGLAIFEKWSENEGLKNTSGSGIPDSAE